MMGACPTQNSVTIGPVVGSETEKEWPEETPPVREMVRGSLRAGFYIHRVETLHAAPSYLVLTACQVTKHMLSRFITFP